MKKGLTIGSMVYNIFMSVVYLFSVPTIIAGAFESENGAVNNATGIIVLAVVGIILAIVNLVSDKKVGIGIKASVLALIGHSLYALFGALLFIPALVLTIIASVFYGTDISKKNKLQ